jgi:hypothetical protein
MGLWRQGPKYTSGFLKKVQIVQKNQRIKEKDAYKKKKREQGIRKYLSRSTSSPCLRLGGFHHKKGRTTEKMNKVDKYREKKYMEHVYLFC